MRIFLQVRTVLTKSFHEAKDLTSERHSARDCTNETVNFWKIKNNASFKVNMEYFENSKTAVADIVLPACENFKFELGKHRRQFLLPCTARGYSCAYELMKMNYNDTKECVY